MIVQNHFKQMDFASTSVRAEYARDLFQRYDISGDGFIDVQELGLCLRRLLPSAM